MTKQELDERLARIVDNRYIYQQARLVDSVEPQVARAIIPAIEEALSKAITKLKSVDLSEFNKSRYQAYVAWAQKELASPFVRQTPRVRALLADVAQMQAEDSYNIMSWDGAVDGIQRSGLTAAKATALVNTPVGGATLDAWMKSLGQSFADRVQRQTIQAMMEGQTYREMVKGLLAPSGPLANGSRTEAVTLARTYTQSVAQGAHDLVMQANDDIVHAKRWSAVFDNRTCPLCAPLDGRVYSSRPRAGEYPIGDMPPAPRHPRCRCLVLPVVKSWMEIVGIQDTEEGQALLAKYKAFDQEHPFTVRERYKVGPKKGKPKPVGTGGVKILQSGVFKGTFEDWLRAYPGAARDILGKQRYELWSSGKVKLDSIIGKGGELVKVSTLKVGVK